MRLDGDIRIVYVPTTPNPTSGFFLMMPRQDVQFLDMSVDAALKYIVTMGVVAPADLPGGEAGILAAGKTTGNNLIGDDRRGGDRKSTRINFSHLCSSRMPTSH